MNKQLLEKGNRILCGCVIFVFIFVLFIFIFVLAYKQVYMLCRDVYVINYCVLCPGYIRWINQFNIIFICDVMYIDPKIDTIYIISYTYINIYIYIYIYHIMYRGYAILHISDYLN